MPLLPQLHRRAAGGADEGAALAACPSDSPQEPAGCEDEAPVDAAAEAAWSYGAFACL